MYRDSPMRALFLADDTANLLPTGPRLRAVYMAADIDINFALAFLHFLYYRHSRFVLPPGADARQMRWHADFRFHAFYLIQLCAHYCCYNALFSTATLAHQGRSKKAADDQASYFYFLT